MITFYKVKYVVGPNGRWLIIKPLGMPRVSWIIIISVEFY